MRRKKVILDISHMADRAVADAFQLWRGPIMSSHSNARDLVPADRQITNETAAEIARRGGMLGISFYEHHLRSSGHATLDDIVRHAVHLARAAGGPEHVGLGSDLDGGFDAKHSAMQNTNQFTELSSKLRRHFSASQVEPTAQPRNRSGACRGDSVAPHPDARAMCATLRDYLRPLAALLRESYSWSSTHPPRDENY